MKRSLIGIYAPAAPITAAALPVGRQKSFFAGQILGACSHGGGNGGITGVMIT